MRTMMTTYLRSNRFCSCHFDRQTMLEKVPQFQRKANEELQKLNKCSAILEANRPQAPTFHMWWKLRTKRWQSATPPSSTSVHVNDESRDCHISVWDSCGESHDQICRKSPEIFFPIRLRDYSDLRSVKNNSPFYGFSALPAFIKVPSVVPGVRFSEAPKVFGWILGKIIHPVSFE